MTRKSKFTDDTRNKVLLALRAGNYDHVAAQFAGVAPQTLYKWLRRGKKAPHGAYREFYDAVQRVQAEVEVSAVNAVRRAWEGGDWRAAAEFLARKHPERWSPQAVFRIEAGDPLADEGEGSSEALADLLNADQIEMLGRQLARLESGQKPEPEVIDVEAQEVV